MNHAEHSAAGYNQAAGFGPERTSLAAVFGFLFSLVGCCLPVGIFGALLGFFGLTRIKGSQGRLGGKGLAIAAIILGLLNFALWAGLVVKSYSVVHDVAMTHTPEVFALMEQVDAGEHAPLRAAIDSQTRASLSDDGIDRFEAAVLDAFGHPVSGPDGIKDMVKMYAQLGQRFQAYQGESFIPLTMRYDNDLVLVMLFLKPGQPEDGFFGAPINDLHVVGLGGQVVKLSDYYTSVGAGEVVTPDATPEEPAEPAAP